MKYRVWPVGKHYDEDRDGRDYEVDSDSAQEAVSRFARARYSELQHVDPGEVYVRCEDGDVMRWSMRVRIVFEVEPLPKTTRRHGQSGESTSESNG